MQVVFRHGARTPLTAKYWPQLVNAWDVCGQVYDPVPVHVLAEDGSPRPKNSHNEQQMATMLPGNCHKGELTREGQHQARHLGRWLRMRYVQSLNFLPEAFQDTAVCCRSTNYSRTIATIQGVLTGLFPQTGTPIPVHTTEEMDEVLFGHPESCQRLKELIRQSTTAAKTAAALPSPEVKALQDHVRTALGLRPDEAVNFLDLHDILTSMQTHGKPIPEGVRDRKVLAAIEHQATERFMAYVAPSAESGSKDEVLRLGMGRLMHLMMQRMDAAAKPDSTNGERPKMYLYSGHDSTIMPLLAMLGKEVDHWPIYCSNLTYELWQPKGHGEPYVRVLYNREVLPLEELCGGETCTLSALMEKALAPYVLTQQERERECVVVHFSHDQPAGGDVKVGSSIEED